MKEQTYRANMNRRRFIKTTLTGLALVPAVGDSQEAIKQLLTMVDFASPKGKKVFIKPNFNTADPCPGSTHNDTLSQLVKAQDIRPGTDRPGSGTGAGGKKTAADRTHHHRPHQPQLRPEDPRDPPQRLMG